MKALVTCSLFFSAAIIYVLNVISSRSSKRPPSPRGWLPLLGHTPYLLSPSCHLTMRKWANELGSVFLLNILTKPCYVISKADLAARVLSTRGPDRFRKAPQVYDPSLELTFGAPTLFNDCKEDEPYQAFRKGLAPAFSDKSMRAVYPVIRDVAQRLKARWQALALMADPSKQGEALDVSPWMQRCFLDIIGAAGFAKDFNALEGGHSSIFQVVHDAILVYDRRSVQPLEAPLCRLLPMLPIAREANRAMAEVRETFSGFLDEFKARGPPDVNDTRIWAQLMRVKDPQTGGPFPDTLIKGNIAILLIAGYDTSSWTSTWALYDIARSPDCQRRIKRELHEAGLLQVPGQPAARPLEWSDLNLPYFNAVLKESMRLHPVAGIGTVRVAPKNMELEGFPIRKGDLLWVPIDAVHNSVHNFTDPTIFDPARWLPETSNSSDKKASAASSSCPNGTASNGPDQGAAQQTLMPSASSPPQLSSSSTACGCPFAPKATRTGQAGAQSKSMLPFSDGPRNCIGLNFAYASVRTVLLSLLASFWFELGDDLKDHTLVEASQSLVLVVQSGIPIKLHLKQHEAPEQSVRTP
ncbi:cytochrome P450 [Dunaliella salina]|uniref:Cytochrome P450 n=1 Tax=Dunaliella salina TaxID=3046 RepID=A0ABQ7GYU2_DUNSA|nr:cytochrome P450 [Dunaliella salina]|eukprot:KAF5839758.1 cytochrome P450 [Dunaliella salina]